MPGCGGFGRSPDERAKKNGQATARKCEHERLRRLTVWVEQSLSATFEVLTTTTSARSTAARRRPPRPSGRFPGKGLGYGYPGTSHPALVRTLPFTPCGVRTLPLVPIGLPTRSLL